MNMQERKHSHYFRDVAHLKTMDLYRFLELFNVTDPCLQHAIKKLVVPGMRGGGKSTEKDLQEAIDTLVRRQEMHREDLAKKGMFSVTVNAEAIAAIFKRPAAGGFVGDTQDEFIEGLNGNLLRSGERWETNASIEAMRERLHAGMYAAAGGPAEEQDAHWTTHVDGNFLALYGKLALLYKKQGLPAIQSDSQIDAALKIVDELEKLILPIGEAERLRMVAMDHSSLLPAFKQAFGDEFGQEGVSLISQAQECLKGVPGLRERLAAKEAYVGRIYARVLSMVEEFSPGSPVPISIPAGHDVLQNVLAGRTANPLKGQADAWMQVYNKLLAVQGELSLDDGDSGTAIGSALTLIDELVAQYKKACTSLRELCPQLEALQIALKGAAEDRCIVVPWSTDPNAAEKVVTALVAQIEKLNDEANVTNKALVDAAIANKVVYNWKGITNHETELSIIAAMAKRIANPVQLAPTYQDLLDATNRLKEAKGVPFVRNFIQKVSGSKKVADVPHDKWEAVIEAINAAMLLTDLQVDV